jgi:hypothetical protein
MSSQGGAQEPVSVIKLLCLTTKASFSTVGCSANYMYALPAGSLPALPGGGTKRERLRC